MGYGDRIDTTNDAAALVPEEYSREIIKSVVDTGWLFRYARRLPNIPVNQERMPVVSSLITAGFLDSAGGEAGLIPSSQMTWANKYVTAGKLGVIVPVTTEVLEDSAFDIWGEIQEGIVDAINVAVTKAVLYGTGAPTQWTTDIGDDEGIVGFATTGSQTTTVAAHDDAYAAIFGESSDDAADSLVGLLETDGFYPTAFVGHPSFRSTLRNTRAEDGDLIFPMGSAMNDIAGVPAEWPVDDSVTKASSRLIAGDWNQLVYAFRSDMRFKMLTEGVIQDESGNITHNLGQQDMQAMRLTVRVGFAMPNPINRMQETAASRSPFSVLTA